MTNQQTLPYQNPDLPIKDRVSDLLQRMDLTEKVAQTWCVWKKKAEFSAEDGTFLPQKAEKIFKNGMGVVGRPSEKIPQGGDNPGPRKTAEICNAMQKYALENTRLGIPFLFHEEGLHGQQARGATMFPQAIAMASTWDPELVEGIYAVVAKEIRARGAHHALTPVIDLARDPRWGRTEETFGEDPYLVSQMGLAAVFGFQGRNRSIGPENVAATAKHFAVHGQPEGGMNCAPANYSERDIRETFLKPFERVVKKAGIRAVMPSYNEVDGVPSHANTWLLHDLLRKEWGFTGITVSDYFAVEQLVSLHHVAAAKKQAAKLAFEAGVDIECPDVDCFWTLLEHFREGSIAEDLLDDKVRRILTLKFELGLFDNPFVDEARAEKIVNCRAHRELAYQTACKAAVLLQNRKNILPLRAGDDKKIAVIGPNAAEIHLGGYSDEPRHGISVLEGLQKKLGGRTEIVHAEGCRLVDGRVSWFKDEVVPADDAENRQRLEEAIAVARDADVVILVLGGNEGTCREGWSTEHLGDRASIELTANQNELVDRIAATGKPVVTLLINGRPLAVQNVAEKSNAVLECWYLGQETGTAVADIIFGDVNPGGKLPVSFPRSAGHIPAFYNHKPSARRGYLFDTVGPLYAFGYGQSYTRFKIGPPRLEKHTIHNGESTRVTVEVTNTGDVRGDEVVQMYIRDNVSSVTRPVKELCGFKRITVGPGKTQRVTLEITPDHLAFFDIHKEYVVEPGEFSVFVGNSSRPQDLQETVLTVTE